MLSNIITPIEDEIVSVHNLIQKHLTIRTGYLGKYAHLEFSSINKNIRPALVILSSRIFGLAREKSIVLASIIQFIYMASCVHRGITENDTDYHRGNIDPRDGSQFPVLVGDYLYGKFFYFLSEAGILSLLDPLADIICQIHEGGILRKKLTRQVASKALYEVVRKETSELFGGCCSLSALLTGAPPEYRQAMRNYGINLGMAYGLLEHGISREHVTNYLAKAQNSLSLIPPGQERTLLEKLLHNLYLQGLPAQRMVI
ncbi:MAG TPA: polyprenyl synthetase family protein [Bacillota bacterium]|jgi:geranylgeranyl pyrophosphate synthase|nr:polyprenyl synthetase family protein [Peptococcaceae bacterium MAG4]HPU35719.1 polyprenyl synthetase family protein [Bacillota bacterium]HPZ43545.1 polyprenyl synthetase family protein [Bacillota bacterium]HQD76066.1 polyprenyl synthetase family protein [Bacillota bacterium]HUM58755.1 polyprenyl synthetase family protein [Bacillota bacterium]